MGIGFVLIFYLVAIGIVSGIIALVAIIISFFASKKEKRKRHIIMSILSPFIGLYTFFVCAVIGSAIVSEIKNTDIGMGDTWYVPLGENCQLLFIDTPDEAYIEKNGQTVISGVFELQQVNNKILGKAGQDKYFIYNITSNELKEFTTENELISQNANIKPNFVDAIDFYTSKRNSVAGLSLIFVGIGSLIISITAVYITAKIITRLTKPKANIYI